MDRGTRVASKPYVDVEGLDRSSLVKVLASLGVERVAVFDEQWAVVFAYPNEDEGRALQSIVVSISSLLDKNDSWVLLQNENGKSLVLIRSGGKYIAAEGMTSSENIDIVVLLGRMLVEE